MLSLQRSHLSVSETQGPSQTRCESMFRATNIHLQDYTSENDEQRLTCDDETLRHVDAGRDGLSDTTIAIDDITGVRRDIDRSQAGFERLSYVFAAFALLFSLLALPFVLAGALVSPIAGGTALSAALCWYGSATFYRMERGTLSVLEIEAGGNWYRFYTRDESAAFDELLSYLPHSTTNRSATG